MRISEWKQRLRRDVIAPSPALGEARRLLVYRRAGLDIGDRTRLAPDVRFVEGRIRIGRDCFVNTGCIFDPGDARIDVEDGVTIGAYTIVAAAGHELGPPERRASTNVAEDVVIGAGSWLGARVTLLSGVTVGRGCVVGAGAVVNRSTRANGLYVGVPARWVRDV